MEVAVTIINEINNMLSKQFKTKMLYMGLPKSVKKSRSILYKFKKINEERRSQYKRRSIK